MAISKRNSRLIVADGIRYRWAFSAPFDSQQNTHRLTLTIQAENGTGTKLIGTGECPTNNEYLLESVVVMTPGIVSTIIASAVTDGWIVDGNVDCFVNDIERFVPDELRKSKY